MSAERFRRARMASGLTQLQLAERVKCDPSTISRIERGEVTPTLKSAEAIARALGRALSELIDERGIEPASAPAA